MRDDFQSAYFLTEKAGQDWGGPAEIQLSTAQMTPIAMGQLGWS